MEGKKSIYPEWAKRAMGILAFEQRKNKLKALKEVKAKKI